MRAWKGRGKAPNYRHQYLGARIILSLSTVNVNHLVSLVDCMLYAMYPGRGMQAAGTGRDADGSSRRELGNVGHSTAGAPS